MKKIACAIGACVGLVGTAQAQSSVTLYGQTDIDVTYATNTQTAARSASGGPVGKHLVGMYDDGTSGLSSSRWGLKGMEDLGGGLKAIFNLESGFNLNAGTLQQGGALFGRLATVGLASDTYGRFTLGRQGDTSVEFVSPMTFQWTHGNASLHPADYDDLEFTRHLNNSIKYVSPSYHGFQFGGFYSLGGVAGSFTQNQIWSVGARYAGGPLTLAASINDAKDPNFSLYASNPGTSTTGNNMGTPGSDTAPASNPAIAGFASASYQRTVTAAATYQLGSALLGLEYSNAQFGGLGSIGSLNTMGYSGNTTLSTISGSVRYDVTPAFNVGTSYDYTHGGSVGQKGSATYQQINLVAGYSLSKATVLFVAGAFEHASGVDSFGQPATAVIGYLPPSATDKELVFSMGIKHNF
jgi:predicted porin